MTHPHTAPHSEITVADALRSATAELADAGVDTPRLDAQLLLVHVLVGRREDLARVPERVLTPPEREQFAAWVARRKWREPLAYLVGEQWFYGRRFHVNRAVLIPRPETEMLVDFAKERAPIGARVADIGTGSGCIAVSVAAERSDLHIVATDIADPALEVARENAKAHRVTERILFLQGDLMGPFSNPANESRTVTPLDLIVSNPPYIAAADVSGLMPEVRDHEPPVALYEGAGDDGIAMYRRLFAEASEHLVVGGWIAVEVGMGQAGDVVRIARSAGYNEIEVRSDLAGIERVVAARIGKEL